MAYIVALDQGTTSCRAILFNEKGAVIGAKQKEFTQYFPKSGWVEHDADEIWATQYEVFRSLLNELSVAPTEVTAIGITNQRETTVVWDRKTGEPIHRAIVWQDKRTAAYCEELKNKGLQEQVRGKTGLVIDSYFSGTKIRWILDNVPNARKEAEQGQLCFGTIDTWLVWKMTKGAVHATDYTNASRTMLYNIVENQWDEELLQLMDVPDTVLPEACPSAHHFGDFDYKGVKIPIMGIAGDQQAALFGQACFEPGEAKNTYGTGCFMLMNTGTACRLSPNGLLTTMACSVGAELAYALEGSIFIAGAAIQWLRDGLKVIDDASDSEYFAAKVETHDVFLVPAFAGLGAPYWDQYSRGAIFGLTRDTGKNHLIKAALESIAFQTRDVMDAMKRDSGIEMPCLKVDGGATANDYLMQFQADVLGVAVDRPTITESTALGAAFLAGLASGIWTLDDLRQVRKTQRRFEPAMEDPQRDRLYNGWQQAVKRTMNWAREL